MDWTKIKKSIQIDLLSKDLEKPNIRLNSLERVEKLLTLKNPNLIKNPKVEFRLIDKNELKESLSTWKESGKISGSESSIINEIYKRI
ncbi:MAG: hypothetical protein COB15_17295 [Flavobacteriales bacterium]|nr:MAG: hypothetical protein COB15_17295 [Flavobacteriales bacterium]